MNEEQLNFLKKFTTTTKNETVYDDFVKKITDVVETTKELSPKKTSFYDLVYSKFKSATTTDKSKVENVISTLTDLQLESYNHVNDHKHILLEIKKAYEEIRRDLTEKYHCVMNRPQEVGVKEFLEYLIVKLHSNASSTHKRLYRSGYYDAIKVIENIIKLHGKDL